MTAEQWTTVLTALFTAIIGVAAAWRASQAKTASTDNSINLGHLRQDINGKSAELLAAVRLGAHAQGVTEGERLERERTSNALGVAFTQHPGSDERTRIILELIPALVASSETGRILWASPKLETLFGYEAGALADRPVEDLVPLGVRAAHVKYRQEYTKNPIARPMGEGLILLGLCRTGKTIPISVGLAPWIHKEQPAVIAIVHELAGGTGT